MAHPEVDVHITLQERVAVPWTRTMSPPYTDVVVRPPVTGEENEQLLYMRMEDLQHGTGVGSEIMGGSFEHLGVSSTFGMFGMPRQEHVDAAIDFARDVLAVKGLHSALIRAEIYGQDPQVILVTGSSK